MLTKNHLAYFIIALPLTLLLQGCDLLRIATSKNHAPEVQTEESIETFMRKHRLENCQALSIGPADYLVLMSLPTYAIFNKQGEYLEILDPNFVGCRDENFFRLAMSSMLANDMSEYVRDSIVMTYSTSEYPHDSFVLHSETVPINVDLLNQYFRTLSGQAIDIYSLYDDILIVYPFSLSGKSKLGAILVREMIEDVQSLEKEFDMDITVVMLVEDRMEWMEGD